MSTYAEMSIEELLWEVLRNRGGIELIDGDDIVELYKRRAARDAILDLAQELDEAGWVVVPREPTREMLDEGFLVESDDDMRELWLDLIEASPPPTREA